MGEDCLILTRTTKPKWKICTGLENGSRKRTHPTPKLQCLLDNPERRNTRGHQIVDTKWVYVIKRKLIIGGFEKFKARKGGRGSTQEHGVNFDETFAQMMRLETWRMLLAIASSRGWEIRQWDVSQFTSKLISTTTYV